MPSYGYGPPVVDFSALGDLPTVIRQARDSRRERQMQDELRGVIGPDGTFDYNKAVGILGQYDPASAIKLMQSNSMTPYQKETLALDRERMYAPTQEMRNAEFFGNMSPDDPRRAYSPKTGTAMTTVDKKAILEAEDETANLDATIEQLNSALAINDKTFSGVGAGARAYAGSMLPDAMVPDAVADPETAKNTLEWQKLMEPEAIKTMASTLKGATTDFELNNFVRLLADPSTPAPIRKRVIERMVKLAENKKALSRTRIDEIRGGNYFAPEGGMSTGGKLTPGQNVGGYKYKGGNPNDQNSWELAQ